MGGTLRVGTDVVDVDRFRRVLDRRPGVAARLLSPAERCDAAGRRLSPPRLAARFAAKEAVMKSLGVGIGAVSFLDIAIEGGRGEPPVVALSGSAARRADEIGVAHVAVSMAHDGSTATATAIAS